MKKHLHLSSSEYRSLLTVFGFLNFLHSDIWKSFTFFFKTFLFHIFFCSSLLFLKCSTASFCYAQSKIIKKLCKALFISVFSPSVTTNDYYNLNGEGSFDLLEIFDNGSFPKPDLFSNNYNFDEDVDFYNVAGAIEPNCDYFLDPLGFRVFLTFNFAAMFLIPLLVSSFFFMWKSINHLRNIGTLA